MADKWGCWLLASHDADGVAPALTLHRLKSEDQARQIVEMILNVMPTALRHSLLMVKLKPGTCWCDLNSAQSLDGQEATRLDGRHLVDHVIKGRAAGTVGEAHLFAERVIMRSSLYRWSSILNVEHPQHNRPARLELIVRAMRGSAVVSGEHHQVDPEPRFKTPEIPPRAVTEVCLHPYRAVFWNPSTQTVQCHRCGEVMAKRTAPEPGTGAEHVARAGRP